ncbi:MAG: lipopolysaccharide transport periplasmic protein LptA [Burkholderiaceae bacterium]|nr:lipopolysaccharide transport periplasmic protein LptA [Burkholderiaceae bacterium]
MRANRPTPDSSHLRRTRSAAVLGACAAAWTLLLATPAGAEKADRDKPINIESNRMQYDDLKQINVFTGNVVLTKGTIVLRADKLVLRQDPEGYQYATATGNLAYFRQKREGVDQYMEGQARQIDYDGKLETYHLQLQAMLRRIEKDRVIDEVHGSDIVYDSRTEFFTVQGGSAGATPGNPSGRVRVVIQPREPSGAPAATPPADTPNPPPAEGLRLEPAEQLGTPRGTGTR